MARAAYWLTPPTRLTFIVSVVLVILALLVRYACFDSGSQSSRFRDAVNRLLGRCSWATSSADFDRAATTQCNHAPKAVLSEREIKRSS